MPSKGSIITGQTYMCRDRPPVIIFSRATRSCDDGSGGGGVVVGVCVVVVVVGVPVVYSFMTTNDPKAFTKGFVTYDRHEHKLRHSKVGTRPPVLDTKDDDGLMLWVRIVADDD